jgi:alkanesulfonate monooxygenase SsuD/methylene tetrahydromethanopterin reductase-like flavin-dependent oxidoreductase (luciferase family)
MADGWMLVGRPSPDHSVGIEKVRQYAREAGRDPAAIGVQGGVRFAEGGPDDWRRDLEKWRELGATDVAVATRGAGLSSVNAHIDALRKVKQELG